MGFERFGRKSFAAQTKVAAFVDYLDKGELRATRCGKCARVFFPPQADCPGCLGSEMEWIQVAGGGKLLSYTTVHYAPAGFEADVPYILGLVDYGGIKALARINPGVPEEALKVGMVMKTVVEKLPGGQIAYGFLPG